MRDLSSFYTFFLLALETVIVVLFAQLGLKKFTLSSPVPICKRDTTTGNKQHVWLFVGKQVDRWMNGKDVNACSYTSTVSFVSREGMK